MAGVGATDGSQGDRNSHGDRHHHGQDRKMLGRAAGEPSSGLEAEMPEQVQTDRLVATLRRTRMAH